MSPEDLHIFLSFLAPGHMIPMLTWLVFSLVVVSIVFTDSNAPLIQPTLDCSPHFIKLLTLPLSPVQNLICLPTPELTPNFISAINSLENPFRDLLNEHHPDFIISDMFYLWTSDLGITRLFFHGTCTFATAIGVAICSLKLHEAVVDDNEPIVLYGMPHHIEVDDNEPIVLSGMSHHIELTRSQLKDTIANKPNDFDLRIAKSFGKSYGMIMNTFCEFESDYIKMMPVKVWHVGPVALCNRDTDDKVVRGGESGENLIKHCLNWLDGEKPGSVLYVCFGSLSRFTCSQLREIALGLEALGYSFILV